jgi:hypothetical protein
MNDKQKKLTKEMQRASGELDAAKQRQAVQEEFAPDYLDIKGVRFFKPKIAHVWLFMRLKHMMFNSLTDLGIATVYALAHNQEKTRNELMRAATRGSIVDDAYRFVCEKELSEDDVNTILKELAGDLLKTDDDEKKTMTETAKTEAALNRSGGVE